MKSPFFLLTVYLLLLVSGCQKDKSDDSDSGVTTLELEYTPSTVVYGNDYNFRVQVNTSQEVVEYGIVYVAWIDDHPDPTPKIGAANSTRIIFPGQPDNGEIESYQKTIAFADFNDANYRAYAILDDGSVIYGEVRYIVFS